MKWLTLNLVHGMANKQLLHVTNICSDLIAMLWDEFKQKHFLYSELWVKIEKHAYSTSILTMSPFPRKDDTLDVWLQIEIWHKRQGWVTTWHGWPACQQWNNSKMDLGRNLNYEQKDASEMGPRQLLHYIDVIMTTMASQITSLTVVYSTVYSDADQRKHQSSASLAIVWGIHRDRSPGPVNSQHKGPVTRKMFPFDDVIIWYMLKLIVAWWCHMTSDM